MNGVGKVQLPPNVAYLNNKIYLIGLAHPILPSLASFL